MKPKRGALILALLTTGGIFASGPALGDENHSPNARELAEVALDWPRAELPDGTHEMAFKGRLVFVGLRDYASDHTPTGPQGGVGIFRITKSRPYLRQLSVVPCQTSGEITVIGDVLVAGVVRDHTPARAGERCNRNGLMLVDISDPRRPRIAKFVGLGCGLIEHTVLRDGPRWYVVTSRTCDESIETPTNAGALEMAIVRVDPNRPAAAREVGNPSDDGSCVDLFVLAARDLMGCASAGHFVLFDVSDPVNPVSIPGPLGPAHVVPNGHAISRGAFTWDGQHMVVAGGPSGLDGQCPREEDASLFFYNVEDLSNPVLVGSWAVPRRSDGAWPMDPSPVRTGDCFSGGFNVLPTKNPARYEMVGGFGSQGVEVIDFSDPTAPVETAFYHLRYRPHDRANPEDPDPWLSARAHAAYWYNGSIYVTAGGEDVPRVRVLEVDGLDSGRVRYFRGFYNPQTQIESFR